ncbi:MAG: TraM recognition domain-containing protein [Chloroflexi bacterium]|nr:TraM recognition domain-containing protein [Chloroflexota bacterium]
MRLIDLAEEHGSPGINLLDTRIFSDRDRTADSVVRVMHGLWEQWGPRMQSILEHTVKSLHEANEQLDRDRQHTILDGSLLISDARFRREALAKVNDPFLLRFWAKDFLSWSRERRGEAIAPVQTRLAYYASSKKARAILGQPRSTIDIRKTILEGGILLVSTAQGSVGRDVAALVGASLLNLVDSVIREQERLPQAQRRGALVVVDEMQSMPGVDYESMLSELGKYGASFILATQSLAKLEDLSRTMRDTILANVGCLAVFQVAGNDARQLVWELGRDRVSEEDIVSLDVHHCYVRATVGKERMPAFSMKLLEPQAGDPAVAARIRADAAAYLQPHGAGEAEGRRRVGEYRRLLAERHGEAGSPEPERKPDVADPRAPGAKEPGDQDPGGRDPRSKQDRPEDGSGEDEE